MRARPPNFSSYQSEPDEPPGPQQVLPASEELPALYIDPATLEQLRQAAVNGLHTMPRHGLEVGGVLVGQWEEHEGAKLRVTVSRFVAVEIGYESGPRFLPNEREARIISDAITAVQAQGEHVVGWWRSHTPDTNLRLTERDGSLTRLLFPSRAAIVLLLLPELAGHSTAALHLMAGGQVSSSPPFPFVLSEEQATVAVPVVPSESPVAESSPEAAGPAGTEAQDSSSLASSRQFTMTHAVLVSALAGGALLLFLMLAGPLRYWFQDAADATSAKLSGGEGSVADGETSPDGGPFEALDLRVQRTDGSIYLVWDRHAEPIRGATEGILEVQDGATSRRIELNAAALTAGRIQWFPRSDSVRFELTVTGEQRVARGMLETHGLAGTASSAGAPALGGARPSPSRTASGSSAERTRAGAGASVGIPGGGSDQATSADATGSSPTTSGQRAATVDESELAGRATPTAEGADTATARGSSSLADTVPQCRATLTTLGYYEKRSRLGFLRALRKLPFVPGGESQSQFSAPQTVEAACPPLASAHILKRPEWVDVVASISEEGAVLTASAIGDTSGTYVAQRTVEAVRTWRFQPARRAENEVESEVQLRVYWSYPPPLSDAAASNADRQVNP